MLFFGMIISHTKVPIRNSSDDATLEYNLIQYRLYFMIFFFAKKMTYKIFYIPFTKTERAVSDTKGRKVIEATEMTSVVVPTGDVTEAED